MKVQKLVLCLLVFAFPLMAQVKIQPNRAHYVNPTDGQQLYMAFCASCHGNDLRGNAALRETVTHNIDLTQIARQYPQDDVVFRVRYQVEHGSATPEHPAPMPEWRQILRYNGEKMMTSLAMKNLTSYIVSNQK